MKTQIITKGKKKEFAVIPYEDYLRMKEKIEDYEDLLAMDEAKADPDHHIRRPFDEFAKEAGLLK